MGYDGGNTIKIMNKKLGEVLDEFAEKGYFPWGEIQKTREQPETDIWGKVIKPKVKYTLFIDSYDSALVEGCPGNLSEVTDGIIDLIRTLEDINEARLMEIRNRIKQDDVFYNYTFVSWEYYLPDWELDDSDGDMKVYTYTKA